MRYLAILAALALTACALPSLSGTSSFMGSMHPSQDFCVSRGLTLDATTKQCVPSSQPAAATDVTGSVPKGTQTSPQSQGAAPAAPTVSAATASASMAAQPVIQEHQRPGSVAPVEPDAVIYADLRQDVDLMSELTHFVRASGYRCDSISALQPLSYTQGFKLVCNHFDYKYAIEEKDGRTTVNVQ